MSILRSYPPSPLIELPSPFSRGTLTFAVNAYRPELFCAGWPRHPYASHWPTGPRRRAAAKRVDLSLAYFFSRFLKI